MRLRLKDISQLTPQYKGCPIDGEVSFVPMESLRNGSIDLKDIPFSEGKGKYTFFENGDLLVAKVTPCFENGNIAIAENLKEGIGFGSSEIFVLRMNEKALNKYMFYLTQSSHFQDAACATMCGVGGLKRISPVFMRTYELELPSIDEQKRIVKYLDEKTASIEDRIKQLEIQAENYSLLKASLINDVTSRGLRPHLESKDSEIDWIGSIPKEWRRLRLKDVAYLYSGLTGKSGDDFRCEDDTLTKPFIPFTNVLNNNYIDFKQFNRVVMLDGETQNQVKGNDLIFLMSSEDYESIAKSAVVIGDPGEVYLNSFCRGLRFTSKDVYAPFVNYQLNSEKYRDALRFEARGFTRINIKIDRIASQFITLPPYDEQVEIATYLDNKCSEIDSNIKNINDQIDALKALKKALINEVITGKRAV